MKTSRTRYYPLVILGFSLLFLFLKYLLQVSPSIMTGSLMRAFHLDGASLGALAATYFYTYLVVQLFIGLLFDRVSPRYLTTAGIALCALGALGFSWSDSVWQAALFRGLIGAGAAFATVSYLKMTSLWFAPRHFAVVSGALASAVMFGSLGGQVILAQLNTDLGWRASLAICGVVGIILAIAYYCCVRDRPAVDTNSSGLQPPKWHYFIRLLRNKSMLSLMLYSGLAFSPLAVFGGLWGTPFLQQDYHLSRTAAGTLTWVTFIGFGCGGLVLGWLAGHWQKLLHFMWLGLGLALVTLLSAIYLHPHYIWIEGVLLFGFGFGTGGIMLGFAQGQKMFSLTMAATVVSLINTGDALFGAITEPLIGRFLDLTKNSAHFGKTLYFSLHDYHIALIILPVYLILAMLMLAYLQRQIIAK